MIVALSCYVVETICYQQWRIHTILDMKDLRREKEVEKGGKRKKMTGSGHDQAYAWNFPFSKGKGQRV